LTEKSRVVIDHSKKITEILKYKLTHFNGIRTFDYYSIPLSPPLKIEEAFHVQDVLAATHAYALMLQYKEFPVLRNALNASPINYYGRSIAAFSHRELTVVFEETNLKQHIKGI
jgi:hypothetical protein